MSRVIYVSAWLGFGYFLYQCCVELINDESYTNVRYAPLSYAYSSFLAHMHAKQGAFQISRLFPYYLNIVFCYVPQAT
jgi:hypothetical protein